MAEKKTQGTRSTSSSKKSTNAKSAKNQYTKTRNYEEEAYAEPSEEKEAPKRRKSTAGEKSAPKKEPVRPFEENPRNNRFVHQVMPYVLLVLGVFLIVCFFFIDILPGVKDEYGVGSMGRAIRNFLCGVFGFGAFFVPLILLVLAFTWNRAVEKDCLLAKNLYAFFSILSLTSLLHVIYATVTGWSAAETDGFASLIGALYKSGIALDGGGVVGGLLGEGCRWGLGLTGSAIITISFTFIFIVFLFGFTPGYVVTSVRYRLKIAHEKRAEAAEARREEKAAALEEAKREKEERKLAERKNRELLVAEQEARREQLALEAAEKKAQRLALEESTRKAEVEKAKEVVMVPELRPVSEEPEMIAEDEIELVPELEPMPEPAPVPKETQSDESDDSYSLEEIFVSDGKSALKSERSNDEPTAAETAIKLSAEMKPIAEEEISEGIEDDIVEIQTERSEPEIEIYEFPPVTLLAPDTNKIGQEEATIELKENAKKLTETLASFNVRIKDISYSRGPTITRYELQPDTGVRVRSIANLVDDIALSLATTGVRIEAPIPNKPAVGIEVPNQNPATVFLRSLIDTDKFRGESSKLTACLGADVAGKPMYFNIAKMPHLLIAGATGMGKSVCINSIIVSLLYKAKPDEVKLILIDPKKVEFNIYKDIPHLYCPIVSDPAKAAGALASAVAEMERRFALIEEVGVRDIYNYNQTTKDDPDHEFMPQMVIIIDELADLMMTAADAVEASICRLAQKARAAGIHIIIGTQRPSVDVITGLLKANIPSRIAFTVASQVDSRTIIDIAGAEKLIGRGDMLYAPVGAAKPMRVQGAFVSEGEVEKIVEFIKAKNKAAEYNADFINRIEEEAAKCTSGKKGGGSGDFAGGEASADGLDPKFRAAVEIAVESGKISTSLLQRKLEIGYGRAAKIIDQMEETGYVSAPDGNKPRKILITKEEFMQMVVNNEIE